MNTLFVGVDVSKHQLENALSLKESKILSEKKVNNNLLGFKALETWFRRHSKRLGCDEIHVCIESTGIYSEGIAEYLIQREDMKVSVVNPAVVKSFGKSIMLRTKTDRVDAGLLAMYCAKMDPKVTPRTAKELKEFRKLVRHHDYLIKRRAQEKSHLESVKDPLIQDSILKIISFYDQEIREAERAIQEVAARSQTIRRDLNLLKTIPGIGDTTARILLAELHKEDGSGEYHAKSQTAHAGLAPSEHQSGISIKGKPRICKTGNARLRKGLYFPALTAIRYNALIAEFYNRLLERGKLKKVAVTACMRKLLVIAIGVLNNQTAFDKKWLEKNQKNRKSA